MALNREEKSILWAAEQGTLLQIAEDRARMNLPGFTHGWTVAQHLERLQQKAAELQKQESASSNPTKQSGSWPSKKAPNFNRLGGNNPDDALAGWGFGE